MIKARIPVASLVSVTEAVSRVKTSWSCNYAVVAYFATSLGKAVRKDVHSC